MGIFGDPYDNDSRDGEGSGNMSGRVFGTVDGGQEVTASFGKKGTSKEGHTYLADGHDSSEGFWDSSGHDHYGSGDGPNNNGTERGAYTGPGS